MKWLKPFYNLRIRYKLLFAYISILTLAFSLGSFLIYSMVRHNTTKNIENNLLDSSTMTRDMVLASASSSIESTGAYSRKEIWKRSRTSMPLSRPGT